MARSPIPFEKQRIRTAFEARILDVGAAATHKAFGRHKTEAIGAMTGTVVELGPGTGANMRYYAPGVRVIAVEPNPGMHDRLRAAADEHEVDIEIRTLRGESIDVDDETADGVVGTLLLCGVDDPHAVVAEARRVLKPGGTYFFTEHVAAPAGSFTRRLQDVMLRPHRWMFNGCETNRETGPLLEAAGFSSVEITEHVGSPAEAYLRHRIVGTAIK